MGFFGRILGFGTRPLQRNCYSHSCNAANTPQHFNRNYNISTYKGDICFGNNQPSYNVITPNNYNQCNGGNCAPQSIFGNGGGLFGGGILGGIFSFFSNLFGGFFGGSNANDYGLGYNNDLNNESFSDLKKYNSDEYVKNLEYNGIENIKKITNGGSNNYKEDFLKMVNQLRAIYGLRPLRLNSELCNGSQSWANEMNAFRGMVHSNLRTIGQRGGFKGFVNSENIATTMGHGASSIKEAFNMWKHSYGHLANMLNRNATDLGIAFKGNKWIMTTGVKNA